MLLLASLASPIATFAAITSVTPNNINQGATATVVILGPGNNFPNANRPYTATFSKSGVSATVTWDSATSLTLTVTATSSATTGLGTLTVNGSGGFAAQTAPFTVNATKLNQSISFGALAGKRPDQMPVTVSATASSGLTVAFSSATPSVCTVTGTTVNYVANGTCTVNANQAGNATYNAAPQVSQSFAIGPASQTITFGALANTLVTDPDFAVSASASSGLAVSFSSATPSVCTVSASTVHLAAIGTCTIRADQAGNASWNPAPQVVQSFTVDKANTTTTVTCPASVGYDGTPQAPCSATVSGPGLSLPIAVSYANNTNAGTATASASFAGTIGQYNPSSDSKTFTIDEATLTVTPDPKTVTYGDGVPTYTFSVTGFAPGENAGNAAGYATPSCTSAFTPSTPVSASPLTITCSGGSADNYTFDTNATAALTINGAAQATLSITGPATKTYGDAPFAPATSGGSGSGAVTFDSTTPSVCTASGSATVTIVGAGTCTVTATKAADANYSATTSASFDVTINKASSTTTVTCPASVPYDGTAQTPCTAEVTFPIGPKGPAVVSYSNNVNAGTATASASFAGSANFLPSGDSTTFTIDKADPACAITGWTGTYDGDPHGATGSCLGVMGETLAGLDLGASFTDVPGGTADWAFTDATGNYNDDSGTADITIAKADPTCDVTGYDVTYDGDPHTATGSCTGVNDEVLDGLDLTATTHIDAGDHTGDDWTFTDTTGNYNDDSGTVDSTIAKADPACTISGWTGTYDAVSHGVSGSCLGVQGETLSGLVLGTVFTNVPGGTATWVFTDGTGNYNDDSGTADVVLRKAHANCSVHGWKGRHDGKPHGASGTCTGIDGENPGTLHLGASFTAVPGGTTDWAFIGNGNYTDTSGEVDIVVEPIDQAITFPPLPNVTTNTTTLKLAATTSSGLPISYVSLTPKVCTVAGNIVTIVGTGTCTIEATQPGDATHAAAEPVERSFTVASATTPPTNTGGLQAVSGTLWSIPLQLFPGLAIVGALAGLLLLLGLRARRREEADAG